MDISDADLDAVIAAASKRLTSSRRADIGEESRAAIRKWISENVTWIRNKQEGGWGHEEFANALVRALISAQVVPSGKRDEMTMAASTTPRTPNLIGSDATQAALAGCGDPNNPC